MVSLSSYCKSSFSCSIKSEKKNESWRVPLKKNMRFLLRNVGFIDKDNMLRADHLALSVVKYIVQYTIHRVTLQGVSHVDVEINFRTIVI